MTTAEKYSLLINEKIPAVHEAGKAQGGGDITQNPLYYLTGLLGLWQNVVFPDGFAFVLELKNIPNNNGVNALLNGATGIKTATLICEAEGAINFNQMIRNSTVEVLDLSNFKPVPTLINYVAYDNGSLVTILGELDLSSCTSATYSFTRASALKDIRFKESTISIALSFANCSLLTAESLNSILNGLSSEVTGQTLTLCEYATVKATYDAVYGEGAWDAIVATKSNWTIAYS